MKNCLFQFLILFQLKYFSLKKLVVNFNIYVIVSVTQNRFIEAQVSVSLKTDGLISF